MVGVATVLQAGVLAAPYARWYLESAFGPDVNTRLVSFLFTPKEATRLHRSVQRDGRIDFAVPRRAFKRWYRAGSTRDDLVAQGGNANDRLVATLLAELRSTRRGRGLTSAQGSVVVEAVVANFVSSLGTSEAIATIAVQLGRKIDDVGTDTKEVLANTGEILDIVRRLDDVAQPAPADSTTQTQLLPGSVRDRAAHFYAQPAGRDLIGIITGGADPETAIHQLVADVPAWLASSDGGTLEFAADLAHAYGARAEAAQLLLLASEKSADRSGLCARAASEFYASGRHDDARRTLSLAERLGNGPAVKAVAAQLDEDGDGVLGVLPESAAIETTFLTSLRLQALVVRRPVNDVLGFARAAVARWPEIGSFKLELSRALLERGGQAGSTTRDADLAEALSVALEARDQRREWGGDSAKAVHYACLAANRRLDFGRSVELGFAPPKGEALEVEAADPEVRVSVAQAALMMNDVETAREVDALGGGDGFHDAYIHGEILAATGAPVDEIGAAYRAAWDATDDDQARALCLLAMAGAGVVDIPEVGELEAPGDELVVLLEAQQLVNSGSAGEAASRLRAAPRTEMTSQLLTAALLSAGDPDGAVTELRDDANRFNDGGRLLRAVEILLGERRLADAVPIALDALLKFPGLAAGARSFLHSVAVQDSADRGAWRDMVDRARAWVAESGQSAPTPRWALAIAFQNDARADDAWATVTSEPELVPDTALHAQLWTALASHHQPGPATCKRIIDLVDQFDDPDLERSAVGAFFLMGDDKRGDPGDDVVARFQALMTKHAVPAAEDPTAPIVVYSGSPEELLEQLKPQLETRASLISDMAARVRNGYPCGMLAAAAGMEYTATLVHRAAGCHPAVSADAATRQDEQDAARAALGTAVSLDPSTVVLGWYIQPLWPEVRGAFSRLELPGPARRDAAASVARFRQPSDGHIYFEAGHVRVSEADPAAAAGLVRHAEWVDAELDRMPVAERTSLSHLARGDELSDRFLSWLAALDQAKELGQPLWSDDVGLRALAKAEAVPAFGTVAVLEVLRDDDVISEPQFQTALRAFRSEYVVDLPLDADWMNEAAAADGWQAGAVAMQFARPSAWEDELTARRLWAELLHQVIDHDALLAPAWLHCAAQGIAKARVPAVAYRSLIEFATYVTLITELNPQVLAACAASIRVVAGEAGLISPSRDFLSNLLGRLSDGLGADHASRLVSAAPFEDEERSALREILFTA